MDGEQADVNRIQEKQPVVEVEAGENEASKKSGLALSGAAEKQQLEEMVAGLNNFVQSVQRQLQFSVDENSGKTVITVIDAETDKVVRQIPSEEVLRMQQHMREVNGLIFQDKA